MSRHSEINQWSYFLKQIQRKRQGNIWIYMEMHFKEGTVMLRCLCKRLSQIHCFSHLLLLLLFSKKFVRAPTTCRTFILLTCCFWTLAKVSMNAFISFHCFSIPNKEDLIRSPSSFPSSALALLHFLLRSIQRYIRAFVPHLSICCTVFSLSELYVLPSLQHSAHCWHFWRSNLLPLGLLELLLEVDVELMDWFWALAKIPLGPGKSKSGRACIGS